MLAATERGNFQRPAAEEEATANAATICLLPSWTKVAAATGQRTIRTMVAQKSAAAQKAILATDEIQTPAWAAEKTTTNQLMMAEKNAPKSLVIRMAKAEMMPEMRAGTMHDAAAAAEVQAETAAWMIQKPGQTQKTETLNQNH